MNPESAATPEVPSRPLPNRQMFHGGDTPRGSRVWAFVRGVPHCVIFEGLLPYNGFSYTDADGHSRHTSSEAYFSATKEGLIAGQVAKKRQEVAEIEEEIVLLEAMWANETLEEVQTAYDRAEHKVSGCFDESPAYYAACDERRVIGRALNAALGKAADATIWG